MKKNVLLICCFFLAAVWSNSFAQTGNGSILLEPLDSTTHQKPRSIIEIPVATLDGLVLTFDYLEATVSQVIISDQNTNAILYSESFASTTEVVVDLEDEGIGEGSYTLWLFAFGKWWWGEFVIEEE